ncbi:MAG: family 10 glycosylhydrolase [Spirochaetaceae bacterium]|nr:family 10 glycosylhydrolase [Spirochaetaceae bacterium]
MSSHRQSGQIARIVRHAGSLVMAVAIVLSAGAEPTDADSVIASRFDEVRALWVIRHSLDSPESVRTMVEEAAGSGFNTLLVQVRGRGDALYTSSLEPRREQLIDDPTFDPLQLVIDEAHARGMDVHAWVNTFLVWGPVDPPRSPIHLVNANPEWLAVPRSLGRELHHRNPRDPVYLRRLTEHAWANKLTVTGLWSSPSHPAVQARVQAVWLELATNYDLQGIHFDYVRLPSPDFDYSRGTLDRFRSWVRPHLSSERYADLVRASMSDPYAMTDAVGDLWDQFRRDQVSMLVRRVYRSVKEVRPELIISAALFADPKEARVKKYQDWWGWLADGVLDVAVPMAYTTDREQFGAWVEEARISAGERERVWVGVGAYKNPVNETLRQIEDARERGVGGVVVFAYDSAAKTPAQPGSPAPLQQIGREAFQ